MLEKEQGDTQKAPSTSLMEMQERWALSQGCQGQPASGFNPRLEEKEVKKRKRAEKPDLHFSPALTASMSCLSAGKETHLAPLNFAWLRVFLHKYVVIEF